MFARAIPGVCSLFLGLMMWPQAAAAEPLRIVVDQHFPPFVQMQDGAPAGLGIELLQAAAQRAQVDIAFVPRTFAQIQTAIQQGEADAIFPLAINPERQQQYDFSAPMLSTGGALFVLAPAPTPATLQALNGKTVMTPKTGPLANYIQRNAPEVKLVTTEDYDETLQRLLSGEAAAVALNLQVGNKLVAASYADKITSPDRYFWELPLAVAIPKTDATHRPTLEKLNQGIQAIRDDGSWQAILNKHQSR